MVCGRLKCLQVREILRVGGRKAGLDVGINLRLRDIETKRKVKLLYRQITLLILYMLEDWEAIQLPLLPFRTHYFLFTGGEFVSAFAGNYAAV